MKKVLLLAFVLCSAVYSMNALASVPDADVIIPVHPPRRSPARNVVLSNYNAGIATIYFNASLKNVRVELYEDGVLVDVVEQENVNVGEILNLIYDNEHSSKSLRVYSGNTLVYSE